MKNILEKKWLQELGILLFSFILFTLNDWILIATWKSLFLGTVYFMLLYTHAQINRHYILPLLLKKQKTYLFAFFTIALLMLFATLLNYVAQSVLYKNCFLHNNSSKLTYQYQVGVLLGAYICIIGTTLFLEYYRKQKEADKREIVLKRNQIDLLNKQLNPHFLFNTLNTIYGLSIRFPEKTPEAIITVSDLLRYQVESANKDFVSLLDEISFIQSYIDIEKERMGYRSTIEFEYHMEEERTYSIAPMIVFTFIENAFKHGTSHIEKSFVKIHIRVVKAVLTLHIENSQPVATQKYTSTKVGLINTKERLKMIYPHRYQLKLESLGDVFKTFLQIKL